MSWKGQRSLMLASLTLLAASVSLGSTSTQPSVASSTSVHSSHRVVRRRIRRGRARGQKAIDGDRVRQIQEALIREHYLKGAPSGKWDASTQQAMRHYQADQGWQNKTVPDSRALIRLGLGPDTEHLLNPESAMTTEPSVRHATSVTASSSARPASVPAGASMPAAGVQISSPTSLSGDPPR
jgi:peptidoglycan hydrolase-like protein with peptidoglycan-binding domain